MLFSCFCDSFKKSSSQRTLTKTMPGGEERDSSTKRTLCILNQIAKTYIRRGSPRAFIFNVNTAREYPRSLPKLLCLTLFCQTLSEDYFEDNFTRYISSFSPKNVYRSCVQRDIEKNFRIRRFEHFRLLTLAYIYLHYVNSINYIQVRLGKKPYLVFKACFNSFANYLGSGIKQ